MFSDKVESGQVLTVRRYMGSLGEFGPTGSSPNLLLSLMPLSRALRIWTTPHFASICTRNEGSEGAISISGLLWALETLAWHRTFRELLLFLGT